MAPAARNARKTASRPQAASRTTSDRDRPKVAFNFDAIERETIVEPMRFMHGGQLITCAVPQELDFRDLLAAADVDTTTDQGQVFAMLRQVLGEDYQRFCDIDEPKPLYRLRSLIDQWREYHGLPALGEAAASPAS